MNKSSKISFLVILLLFFSCRKDFERPNWDVDLLAPLVKTSLTLDNLLPDSVLVTNPDTSLKIVYQTSLFDIDMDLATIHHWGNLHATDINIVRY